MGVIVEQAPVVVARHASGKLVTIDKVEKGLACNCFCPDCNAPLIAKKGEKVHHHFAHKSHDNEEVKFDSCGYDFWRSLHLLCYKALKEHGGFRMPTIKAGHKEMFLDEDYTNERKLIPGKYIKFDKIEFGYLTKGQQLKTIIVTYGPNTFLICPLFSKEKDSTTGSYQAIARKGKGKIAVVMIDMDGIKENFHPTDTKKFYEYVIFKASRYWSSHGARVTQYQKKIKDHVIAKVNEKKAQYQFLLNQLQMQMEMNDLKIYRQNIVDINKAENFKEGYLEFRDFEQIELKTKRHFLFMRRSDDYNVYLTLSTDKISPPKIHSKERDICIWISMPDSWRKNDKVGELRELKYQRYIPEDK